MQRAKCGLPKKTYHSLAEALRTAGLRMISTPGLKLYTYECRHCKGWHLTRQKQHASQEVTW